MRNRIVATRLEPADAGQKTFAVIQTLFGCWLQPELGKMFIAWFHLV